MLVDAQDIDALLIGALYGELTPADEARLAVHLESHPTDRTALDDLTHARSVVRQSRIFEVQLEPPQAVSALLLQEAARRAPKISVVRESESWFQRFVRSFMSHPAMAAAAMLVLVVGVAGTLYVRQGDHFADERAPVTTTVAPSIALQEREQQLAPAAPTGAAAAVEGPTDKIQSGSAYNADLAGKDVATRDSFEQKDDALKFRDADNKKKGAAMHDGVVVHTPQTLAPREMAESRKTTPPAKVAVTEADKQEIAANGTNRPHASGGAPGGASASDPSSSSGYAVAPPPPPVAPAPQASPPATVQRGIQNQNDTTTATATDQSLVSWAKDQHTRVQALVKAGKCQDAAQLALGISAKAPDYYAQYVATDRVLKPCATYINDARDKEAEKSQKARAAKRVNANEPAPATQDLK